MTTWIIQHQLKLRLKPAQERQLERWLFQLTGVWNWAVTKLYRDGCDGTRHSGYAFKALLNGHSQKIEIPAHVLQGMAGQAHDAYARYRSGFARRPRLKSRRNRLNSIPFDHGFRPRSKSTIYIPGIGLTRFHKQDIPAGHVGLARLLKRASGWHLCLFIRSEPAPIARIADGSIGIDPGFSSLLTTSAGEVIEHPNELLAGEQRIAQAQRGHRSTLTARLRERETNRRKDRNHKLSRRLVAENRLIAWSKDNTTKIARSFGKSVRSASHYKLKTMLAYKSRAGGRVFVEVASRNSTRTCSACRALTGPTGYAGLSVRQWTCGHCGTVHDRDVNAAINTLAGAGAVLECACEGASGISIDATRRGSISVCREVERE